MTRLSLTVLTLTLVVFMCPPCFSDTGLGISHYPTDLVFYTGQLNLTEVSLGRIYNTGNETFILEPVWVPVNSTKSLNVTIKESKKTLAPGDSFVVVAIVQSNFATNETGVYCSTIDLIVHRLENVTGNPIVPGGTLKVSITVKPFEKTSNLPSSLELFYSVLFIGLIVAVATCVCTRKFKARMPAK